MARMKRLVIELDSPVRVDLVENFINRVVRMLPLGSVSAAYIESFECIKRCDVSIPAGSKEFLAKTG